MSNFSYECHVCGAMCDPGELENGVCFECRSNAVQEQDRRNCQTIREINQLMRARHAYAQHPGVQMMGGALDG